VCLDEPKCFTKLECGHIFCEECIYTWVLEDPSCPTCRTKQSQFIVRRANYWGIQKGLVYRPETVVYNLSFLEEHEARLCNMFLHGVSIISDDTFKSVIEISEFGNILEKMKRDAFSCYPIMKKVGSNPEKLHKFIYV
jgi:hypothetical protein